MPDDQPLLTVGIPTYNSACFLPDAIASIMKQGVEDLEILIIDNASEDNTEDVVRALHDDRIRYIRNATNIGSRENFNRCILNSRARYIKLLCADDVLLDGVLLRQMRVLKDESDVTIVSCDALVTNWELKVKEKHRMLPGRHSGGRVINACLSGLWNYIGGPSNVMFRRADAVGISFDNSYRLIADLKFFLQLLKKGSYFNIGQAGYFYRRHSDSDTETNCSSTDHINEIVRLIEEFRWWNPLNCLQIMRHGRSPSSYMTPDIVRQICSTANLLQALAATPDVAYMRLHIATKHVS
jgi:glycosyltransferase involved in cell wall biosynthesis